MKKLMSLALFFSACAISSAYASKEVGNGGNAVVCFDDKAIANRLQSIKSYGSVSMADSDIPHITSVELLDLHKAKIPKNVNGVEVQSTIIEAHEGETVDQYLERIKKRFSTLYPNLVDVLKSGKDFFSTVKSYAHGIEGIDDVGSGEVINSGLCVRATIIAQFYEPNGNYIAYDSRIFNLPSNIFPIESRALSFWHEYLYAKAKYHTDAPNSDSTQSLLGAIATEETTLLKLMKLTDRLVSTQRSSETLGFDNYLTRLAKKVKEDFQNKNLLSIKMHDRFTASESFFNLDDKARERLRKKFLADPNVKSFQAKTMKNYKDVWQPVIYSLPDVPLSVMKAIDTNVLEYAEKLKDKVECSAFKPNVECRMRGLIWLSAGDEFFDFQLPN